MTAVWAVALLVTACTLPSEPRLPPDAVPWTAPARFALWWRMTEACSGRSGDLRSIQWYVVPHAQMIEVAGERYHGYTFASPGRIVLADAHRLDGPLV
ncbi:MAG TPA: hypothetical protein VJT85_07965, partial [Gemmatimonadaceae bacterium]|nr:hypothetical protein [Gemmatimonadaceae bacterium]